MVTAKSHFLRAKVLHTMARYGEAHAAYAEFANLMNKHEECTLEEIKLKEEIDNGMWACEDTNHWLKDQLMHAVDVHPTPAPHIPHLLTFHRLEVLFSGHWSMKHFPYLYRAY